MRSVELFQTVSAASTASVRDPRQARRYTYSTNVGVDARVARTFVLFFDDLHLTRDDGERAKVAITTFIEGQVRDGDLVSLVAPGQSLRWHARMPEGRAALARSVAALKGVYSPDLSNERMSDYEAYRIHVFQDEAAADRVDRRWKNFRVLGREPTDLATDKGFQPQNRGGNIGIIKQDIAIRAAAIYGQLAARNRATLEALERNVSGLAAVRGRKSLVLVSPGFIEDQERREQAIVLDAARRANVAVYFVDARGLFTGSPFAQAQFGSPLDTRDIGTANADPALEAEGAEQLSVQSGGFSVRNSNDLAGALHRIGRESDMSYLIGFRPTGAGRSGAFHRIEVRVNKPGLQVRARRGYYAGGPRVDAKSDAKSEADELSRATESPYDLAAVPLLASAYVFGDAAPGRALTMLAVEADLRAFAFSRGAGGALGDTLELRATVTDQTTGATEHYERDVAMTFPATVAFDATSWRGEVAEFRLAPGRYQARIAVRDKNSQRIGSVTHDFDVPPLDQLRVTTPIVTDTIETPAYGSTGPPKPVLIVRRFFPAGATLYYQFSVLGASTTGGAPRVSAGHEIRRADGTLIKRMEPRAIAAGAQGGVSRFSSVSLAGVAAGDYDLVLKVTDDATGRTIELHEPFALAGPVGSVGGP